MKCGEERARGSDNGAVVVGTQARSIDLVLSEEYPVDSYYQVTGSHGVSPSGMRCLTKCRHGAWLVRIHMILLFLIF
jgi:hypothetical protein